MKNTIDFMLYSYFKITADDDKETILQEIINKAYDDATMLRAYNYILEPELKQKSDEAKKAAGESLLVALQYGIFEKTFNPIDAMTAIKATYDKNVNVFSEYFSFGNAQKWVNMSIKYILIVYKLLSALNEKHEFCKIGKKYEEKKVQFDLPVDSYILEKMWSMKEIEIPLLAEKRTGKYSADKVKPWSQWNKDEYMAFRESVHNSIECPLDWEGPVWIEVAKTRALK